MNIKDYEIDAMNRSISEVLRYHETLSREDCIPLLELILTICNDGIDKADKGNRLNADFNIIMDELDNYLTIIRTNADMEDTEDESAEDEAAKDEDMED